MSTKLVNGKRITLTVKDVTQRTKDKAIHDEDMKLAYRARRVQDYPSLAEQLDKIYHDGIDSWKVQIKAIKDKYPKP